MDKNTININKLPSKTWYWLHMNDTKVSWNPDIAPCKVTVEEAFEDKETNSLISGDAAEFATVESGAGREADSIFADAQTEKTVLTASDKDAKATIRLAVDGTTAASAAGACYLTAEEGTDTTIIETFTKKSVQAGSLAYRTMIQAKKDSRVRLVQVFMQDEEQTLLNDIGCVCDENAKFDILQIFIGKGDLYNGIRTDLKGTGADTQVEIGYLGQKTQKIDVNLIINHFGKKTNCEIQVDGTLKDAAEKVFRGTIDFKNGASESTGAETENVLLLGDDVINKTIPIILCAEEDVEGSHGATIGELDEETLFYFESRGIDKETAEDIMTRGKFEMLYRHIGDEQTQKLVEAQLAEVMADDREEL